MCCLFGFYNYSGKEIGKLKTLTNSLAVQATVRGTDASGIAYNDKGKLVIHKEPKSADKIEFKHPDNAICVMGHTRHSTQGSHKKNCNNHPFYGRCKNVKFAFAHNGVLLNDKELKKQYHLPKTKIETDSYVGVQLLEKKKVLNNESIKFMAEKTEGSFAYSILDSNNTLWLIRGDSPLSLVHIPRYKLYVYASTDEILYKALVETRLFDEIKAGKTEEIPIESGDVLKILPDGTIVHDKFKYTDYSYFKCNWWNYDMADDKTYLDDLKMIAQYHGYDKSMVDDLIGEGFTLDEVEEYIYCSG